MIRKQSRHQQCSYFLFITIILVSIFKLVYIQREFHGTDYSVYVISAIPFLLYFSLQTISDISSLISINWICTIPMCIYLYQSIYLTPKQWDLLIVYSIMGIVVNLLALKKLHIKDLFLSIFGFIMLLTITVVGIIFQFVTGIKGTYYELYCTICVLKYSKMFSTSNTSSQYLEKLFIFPDNGKKQYFIAEKICQYGMAYVVIIFVLILCVLAVLLINNYKKNKTLAFIANLILILQSVCYFLSNIGLFKGSVFELPFTNNIVYSLYQLVLLFFSLGFSRKKIM